MQMLSRFTDFRTSPWSKGVTALRKANSKTIRLLQYSLWSPAVVRNVNSRVEGQDWEETRVQVLASALLSQSDIVCLQGLEHEQAVWLKQALNSQVSESACLRLRLCTLASRSCKPQTAVLMVFLRGSLASLARNWRQAVMSPRRPHFGAGQGSCCSRVMSPLIIMTHQAILHRALWCLPVPSRLHVCLCIW